MLGNSIQGISKKVPNNSFLISQTHPCESNSPSQIYFRVMLWKHKMHNFVPQLATWRVVISGCAMVGYVGTHFHHSQLATWWVVAQSCAFLCVPSITLSFLLSFHPHLNPSLFLSFSSPPLSSFLIFFISSLFIYTYTKELLFSSFYFLFPL